MFSCLYTAALIPTGVRVVQSGLGQLTVSWTRPRFNSQRFRLTIVRYGDFGSKVVWTDETSYIFGNLKAGDYVISISNYGSKTTFSSLSVEERIALYGER